MHPDGHYIIKMRTRFDETTTSPNRPKDAPLTPSPREVRLADSTGHEYAPVATAGTPLLTPLKPPTPTSRIWSSIFPKAPLGCGSSSTLHRFGPTAW